MHYAPERTARADHDTARCARCGITRQVHASRRTPLCRDCADVTRTLGEHGRWTA